MFNTIVNKINTNRQNVDIKLETMRGTITPIDPNEAASVLQIDDRAIEDAHSGIPLPQAEFPGLVESHIQNFVSQHVDQYIEWGNARLKFCDDTMHDNEVENKIVLQLKNTVKKFEEQDLKAWSANYSSDLNDCKKKSEEAAKNLDEFRKINDLKEIPYKRSTTQKLLDAVLLLGLLLFECIINAGLFAKGMSTGLMGGILVAAVAAIINIAASWYVFAQLMGGLKIRCNSKTTHFKIGLLVTLLWFVIEVAFSFGVAHYREALAIYAANGFTGPDATIIATQNYFHPLSDILSWGLWLLTIIFGTIAYIDGIWHKEPFPHYEYKYDQTEKLRVDFQALFEEALEELNNLKNTTVDEIRNTIDKIETNFAAFSNAVADKETAETEFNNAISTSRTAYKALIKRYQETNVRNRTTELRKELPAYFSTTVNITDAEIWKRTMPRFDIASDKQRLAEQVEQKRAVQQELEKLITTVQEASADAIKLYQLKQLKSETGEAS
ncbi:hypothetical protein [uncultured Duodenibacillus sp.]|uniref:hypothetical protein n=1 Tax=uncultured Duodenibacillus sp. TaxID=1980699 RepID=UPI002592B8FF|nr:hypothetical protein [uncultured Duodenibacillus sp.]